MPNYKLIFQKLQITHPEVAREAYFVQRKMNNHELLKVFTIFCKMKGVDYLKIGPDRADLRDLLIAVFVMIYDPEYFMVDKKIRTGLRTKVSLLAGGKGAPNSISYNFKNVKNYLSIYKEFKEEAEYISNEIKKKLDGKEEKHKWQREVDS